MQGSKRLLLAAALAVAGASVLNSAPAEARTVVYATMEPPALRVEHVPPPRHGYVWAPGYWSWGHRHYNWQRGHWERERHGYHYAPARWERDGNRWRYQGGRWDH
jgi:hypothetical protein